MDSFQVGFLLCVCDLNLTSPYFRMEGFGVPVPGLCAAQLPSVPLSWTGVTLLPHSDLL